LQKLFRYRGVRNGMTVAFATREEDNIHIYTLFLDVKVSASTLTGWRLLTMERIEQTDQTLYDAGPSLLALAVVYMLLVAASIISGLLLKHGSAVVNPYSPADEARRFFANNPVALRVSSFFLFGSSVPLGIYTAAVVNRLRFLRASAAGTYIALGGGFAASASLAGSGLCTWVLSVPEVSASLAASRLMHFMAILFGGVSFGVAFGLLTAGVSVTSHALHLLPRWQVWFGIFIAAAGELSSLSLVVLLAAPLIPVVRLCGFIWLIAVGATLPKTIRASEAWHHRDSCSHRI
jgi:hypothetical protein